MSILDKLTEKAGSLLGGNKDTADSVLGMIKNQEGGLGGLIEQFKSKGLGDIAASWVGTGENKSISPNQIMQVLGNEKVQAIAAKLGISTEEMASKLSTMLPVIIDKLTPDGAVPEGGLVNKGMDALKKLIH